MSQYLIASHSNGYLIGEDQDVKSPANCQAVLEKHKLLLPCVPFKYQEIHVSRKTIYNYLSLEQNSFLHLTKYFYMEAMYFPKMHREGRV